LLCKQTSLGNRLVLDHVYQWLDRPTRKTDLLSWVFSQLFHLHRSSFS
jgi:hypothetical protein